jgi:hypothetical protein
MKPITVTAAQLKRKRHKHAPAEIPPAPHPEISLAQLDEEWTLKAAAQAQHFLVSLFLGRGAWDTLPPLKDLGLAHRAGLLLEKVHANGRTHLIYAVTPEGRSVLIPASLLPKLGIGTIDGERA